MKPPKQSCGGGRARFRVVWLVLALSSIVIPAAVVRPQDAPSARSAAVVPAAARPPVGAHLRLDAEHALTASPPVSLLRIGERFVMLSGENAAQLTARGEALPIAGGRDARDFAVSCDARFAYVVGGFSSSGPSADVWRVGLGAGGLEWTRTAVLPVPCIRPAAAIRGTDLFVAGRDVAGSWFLVRIDLAGGAVAGMKTPPYLDDARSLAALNDALYLTGKDANGAWRHWRWKDDAWSAARPPPGELLGLSPIPMGPSHLFYPAAGGAAPILAYHAITDTWSPLLAAEGETLAWTARKGGVLRVIRRSGGGLALCDETLVHPKRGLSFLDYTALAAYFGVNLGIGFLCARRKAGSDDFFRGSGRIQWWALGISYMATGMSSISFMAYPAMAYASNWLLIGVPVFQSAAVVVAGILFIRMFRRLNITTIFEYLEQRFGRFVRLLGAAFMILSQVGGRLSIVMLLPAMAFSAVTGLNVYVSVLLMGIVTVIYCLKGGMRAVVWTDVLQFILMYGAIAFALVTIAHDAPGGFGGLVSVAHAENKLKAWLFDWDFVRPTVWVFSCLAVTTVFLQLSDQTLMQRALSAPNEKAARNSVMLAGVLNVPISLMLFAVGSALFVFYRQHAGRLDPTLPTDSIFPYFVGTELPHGVVGLIIAGIFAASMSTVSGSVNAIAAIVVRDFLLPARPESSEATRMRVARVTTVVVGGLATGIAAVMAGMNIQSLWETFAAMMALIGGGFPGIFALGLLTRRANAPGAALGLLASIAITFAVRQYTATNVFLFTSVAVGSCIGVGYAASLLFAPPARPLVGLTIHTLRDAGTGQPADRAK